MGTPSPPPARSDTGLPRAVTGVGLDYTAYTRKTRAFEPDAPELRNKRIERTRLTELERIPAEVRDIHRALARALPEQVFEPTFLHEIRALVQSTTDMDCDLWLDSVRVLPRSQLRTLIPGTTFLTVVGLEPTADKVLVELDLRFVYAVVDRLLGGRGSAVDVHRPLTDIEQGVFSFLLLKVLALFQRDMERVEQVAVRLEDMRNEIRACADILRREDHWLVASWKMNFDLDVSFIRALVPVSLARRLSAPSAPPDSAVAARRLDLVRRRLGRLGQTRWRARVVSGYIDFSPSELGALDPGDIIVLDHTGLALDEDGAVAGHAWLEIGRGRRGRLAGVVGPVEGQRVFQIERLELTHAPDAHDPETIHGTESNPEDVMAEYEHHPEPTEEADDGRLHPSEIIEEDWGLDDENGGGGPGYGDEGYAPYEEGEYTEGEPGYGGDPEGYQEGGYDGQEGGHDVEDGYVEEEVDLGDNLAEMEPLLGDMPVHVVVELGRVELTADEVISLRPGQLIELGRAPTDPVDLVVDGRVLAKGELVEIEGQLGVRIQSLTGGAEG